MNQLFFSTRAPRCSCLSNVRGAEAQILEHISTQQSEYEFLKRSIENYDIYVIALNRYENDRNYRHLSLTQLDTIFNKILERIEKFRLTNPDKYIFVLFSESFFGVDPLTDVQSIVDKCKSLSNQHQVIVQASFLYRFDAREAPPWLHNHEPITKSKQIAERITRSAEEAIKFLIADRAHPDRIANYTLTFYSGEILAIYRKSTYCRAAENLIIPGKDQCPQCAYEFGDFQSHKLHDSSIAELFCGENSLVATRMCSDMNGPNLSSETRLVIVHSNSHPNQKYHYENPIMPILFVDDEGISALRIIKNRFSRSSYYKPIDMRLRPNPDFINWRSYFYCFSFELLKILNVSRNCRFQILDDTSLELN